MSLQQRAWKAVSEFVGNAHNPESTSQLKGTKKSSKKTKTKESAKTNGSTKGVERNQPKIVQNSHGSQPPMNVENLKFKHHFDFTVKVNPRGEDPSPQETVSNVVEFNF